MSKECKCEHWQQCHVCMPHRFDKNGHLLPPEPTTLQAARIRIEELERDLLNLVCRIHRDGGHYIAKYGEAKAIADADTVAAQNNADLDALQADNVRIRESTELLLIARQTGHYRDEWDMLKEALAATPEQSLAEYRNKVIEDCAAVLNVAITRLSSCGASIKNDVAISTLKEQSCRLRAMKEQQ